MLNQKTKALLFGGASFLLAILTMTVLIVGSGKFEISQNKGLSNQNKALSENYLQNLKTTVFSSSQLGDLGVCQEGHSGCPSTDTATISLSTAGNYKISGKIKRGGTHENCNDGRTDCQDKESFYLYVNDVKVGDCFGDCQDGNCSADETTTAVDFGTVAFKSGSNTIKMEHVDTGKDGLLCPDSVSIVELTVEDGKNSSSECGNNVVDSGEECDDHAVFGPAPEPVHCGSGYTCNSSCKCEATNITYSCTGTAPSNATLCSGDDSGLTADTAKTLVSACTTATKCEYTCNTGYTYDSTSKTCKANTYSCTGTAPSNATLCSGDDSGLTADTAKTLVSACTDSTKCEYTCNTGYTYDTTSKTCKVSTPTCSISFSPNPIKVGEYSTYSWSFGGGYDVASTPTKLVCTVAGVNNDSGFITGVTASGSQSFGPYNTAGQETCSVYFNNSSTASCSTSLTISGTYSCTGTAPSNATLCSGDDSGLTADTAKTLVSACTTATKCEYTCNTGYTYDSTSKTCKANTYSCTGTAPSNATLCSGDDSGLTADTAKTLVSACTTATKCEYTCNNGYTYDSTSKTCKQNSTKVDGQCGTANKTYSSSATSFGSDTFCSAGTSNSSSPTFPATGSSTTWTCQGQNGGASVSCTASRSKEVTNGKCGSADGDKLSSAPSSNLCSSGNASSVSGSGSWYWTCQGINGGTTASCSADKKNSATANATVTTTVIPVTQYTYSYTAKVAPASGTATNVALLLSASALITLGVWVVIKKIKG